MPVLKNAKWEQVAQLAAQGIDQTHAYLTVYPKSSEAAARSSAATLLANPSVRARVQELSGEAADEAVVTAAAILKRAWEIAQSDAKDRIPALNIAARAFPEFRESAPVDARSLTFVLPDGTSLEDLKRLRAELA